MCCDCMYVHDSFYAIVDCIYIIRPNTLSLSHSEWLGKLYDRYNGTYPLLNHFVDALTRCRIRKWDQNDRKPQSLTEATFFGVEYCTGKEWQNHLDYVKSAVACYESRLVPQYKCMPYSHKIIASESNDDKQPFHGAVSLVEILFAAVDAIGKQLTSVPQEVNTMPQNTLVPVQIDLLILHHPKFLKKIDPIVEDEEFSDPEDSPEEEQCDTLWHAKQQNNDFVKNLLDENKIKYNIHDTNVDPNIKGHGTGTRWPRLFQLGFSEFTKLKRAHQRVIFAIDKSQIDEEAKVIDERLFTIHAPAPYNGFEELSTLSPPALHMNSIVESIICVLCNFTFRFSVHCFL